VRGNLHCFRYKKLTSACFYRQRDGVVLQLFRKTKELCNKQEWHITENYLVLSQIKSYLRYAKRYEHFPMKTYIAVTARAAERQGDSYGDKIISED